MEYRDRTFDEERALYGLRGAAVRNCRFDGPADGESALKESSDIEVSGCYLNLRYPLWHVGIPQSCLDIKLLVNNLVYVSVGFSTSPLFELSKIGGATFSFSLIF